MPQRVRMFNAPVTVVVVWKIVHIGLIRQQVTIFGSDDFITIIKHKVTLVEVLGCKHSITWVITNKTTQAKSLQHLCYVCTCTHHCNGHFPANQLFDVPSPFISKLHTTTTDTLHNHSECSVSLHHNIHFTELLISTRPSHLKLPWQTEWSRPNCSLICAFIFPSFNLRPHSTHQSVIHICRQLLITCHNNLYSSVGQIIKSPVSVCLTVCGRSYSSNFYLILMKFCTVVRHQESKIVFVWGGNPMTPSLILPPIFTPIMHFQWKGSNTTVRRPENL